MRSQTGSAAKPIMLLTLLIAGAVAVYMSYFDAKRAQPEGGKAASFMPHDEQVRMELQAIPSQRPFTIKVAAELAEMTHVEVDAPASTECDVMLVNQIYTTCSMHRVQQHHDNKCHVVFHYQTGECAQPLH